VLLLAGCGGGSGSSATSSTGADGASSTTGTGGSVDACLLTAAEVTAIVGFTVTDSPAIVADSCTYEGEGNLSGSVMVTVTTFASEKEMNVIRDGNGGEPMKGVTGAFIEVARGDAFLYQANTETHIVVASTKLSPTQIENALIALTKKFVGTRATSRTR
jgi:hypothetical protein